ncbi:MAG TPA: hypothetical protein VE956_15850 [Nodularia sp. (in: cyanobacteria)]|nr:hypothetical protein [Nodularia sp. (in: cyanobacteria)]
MKNFVKKAFLDKECGFNKRTSPPTPLLTKERGDFDATFRRGEVKNQNLDVI